MIIGFTHIVNLILLRGYTNSNPNAASILIVVRQIEPPCTCFSLLNILRGLPSIFDICEEGYVNLGEEYSFEQKET